MVAQSFTRLVAWAMPAIMASDSIWVPQWLVSPPKPRHLPIDMTKSMPTSSAVTAAARFCFQSPSSGGVVEEMIQPPLATGRKTPNSCCLAPMGTLLFLLAGQTGCLANWAAVSDGSSTCVSVDPDLLGGRMKVEIGRAHV